MQETNWYALYTAPRAEKKVNTRLQEKGITTYLPLVKILKQWSDRKKWVEEPAFKSYIFINGDEETIKSALVTQGVLKIVSFSQAPQKIPNNQIKWLKLLLNSPELLSIDESLKEGNLVEITSGPLNGIKGVIIDFENKKSIAVNIEILGRSIITKLSPHMLKKTAAS